jgi:CheY-like chemotaxis protein
MKILIFDDSMVHQLTARKQLKEHELTVTGDLTKALCELNNSSATFDVVLTDLMVSTDPNDPTKAGQEMPAGMALALLALKKGIKAVAIVTDANHHDHPGVRVTDLLTGFTSLIGESRFVCLQEAASHYDRTNLELVDDDFLVTSEGMEKYPEIRTKDLSKDLFVKDEDDRRLGYKGLIRGKRWDWALNDLFEALSK